MSEQSQNFVQAKQFINQFFQSIQNDDLEQIKHYFDLLLQQQLKDKNFNSDDEQKLQQFAKEYFESLINETKEGKGRTILHFACARGDIFILDYLVQKGGDLNIKDAEGNSPICIAVQHKNLEMLKHIGQTYKFDLAKVTRGQNINLLHIACSNGDIGICSYLIKEHGMDPSAQNITDGTPFQWAVSFQQTELVKHLIKQNVKARQPFSSIPPPLIMAVNLNQIEIAECLLDSDPLLAKEETDANKWSALHVAAELGHQCLCEMLLRHGADQNYVCEGQTALDLAIQHGHFNCVSILRPITDKHLIYQQQQIQQNQSDYADQKMQMTQEERSKVAMEFKEKGNDKFKNGNYEEAIEQYTKAVQFERHVAALYTNRAACYINLKDYNKALQDTAMARQIDPAWTKTYFREAEAYLGLLMYADAAASFWEGLYKEPKNIAFKEGFLKAKALAEQHQKKYQL